MSIIPGIEARAPDRTERRSGFFGSPKLRPSVFSIFFRWAATSSFSACGYFLPFS